MAKGSGEYIDVTTADAFIPELLGAAVAAATGTYHTVFVQFDPKWMADYVEVQELGLKVYSHPEEPMVAFVKRVGRLAGEA